MHMKLGNTGKQTARPLIRPFDEKYIYSIGVYILQTTSKGEKFYHHLQLKSMFFTAAMLQ